MNELSIKNKILIIIMNILITMPLLYFSFIYKEEFSLICITIFSIFHMGFILGNKTIRRFAIISKWF